MFYTSFLMSRHDHFRTAQSLPRPSSYRSAHARRGGGTVIADHPAHGSKRRRNPRQRGFADEACRRTRLARHRARLRECGEPKRRPRRASQEAGGVTLTITLACAAALLALGAFAVIIGRSKAATRVVYGASLLIAAISLAAAVTQLVGLTEPFRLTLPLGIPWLGAHFRLDALSAFFLVVVDLGAASASLFALGYGGHEKATE